MRFSVCGYYSVVRAIVLLADHINPPTIFWRISKRVVNSVKTQVFTISVFQRPRFEVNKTVLAKPFFANGYPFATVVMIQIIIWVIASGLHIRICSIQMCSKCSVRCVHFDCAFASVTSATGSVSASEIVTANDNGVAAIAQAIPCNFSVSVSAAFSNNG